MRSESPWLEEPSPGQDTAIAELSAIGDADELCRRLLASAWGWGSSSHGAEAVDVLASVRGTGTLPNAFLAMLLCTCDRWSRVTAKLIVALEASGILTGSDLDELAESFLVEEVVINYPFLWACPQGLDFASSDETEFDLVLDEHTMAQTRRRPEAPLRRWATARALRSDPRRLDELLDSTGTLQPYHRDAALHGLLDAADALAEDDQRRLVERGLRCGVGGVRRAALDQLCKLDGPDAALRRAHADANRAVRAWQPAIPTTTDKGAASGRAAGPSTLDARGADMDAGSQA
jgi:hypothetical protein